MPFKSKAQRAWMYANKPEMAEEWQEHTPKGKKLPKKVKSSAMKKTAGYLAKTVLMKVAAEEEYGLDPNHFRNRLGVVGPVSGALGSGLRPITDMLEQRLSAQKGVKKPTLKGLFKNLPWRESLHKMPRGLLPGAISGVVIGHLLDKYLQSRLRRKDSGLLSRMTPMTIANNVVEAVEPVTESVTKSVKGLLD